MEWWSQLSEQVHFRTEPHFEKFHICQKAIFVSLLFISSEAPFAFRNRVGLARKRKKLTHSKIKLHEVHRAHARACAHDHYSSMMQVFVSCYLHLYSLFSIIQFFFYPSKRETLENLEIDCLFLFTLMKNYIIFNDLWLHLMPNEVCGRWDHLCLTHSHLIFNHY